MLLQREAITELLADLLLDKDLMDAQVELVLPMAELHWRILGGICHGRCRPWKVIPLSHHWALPRKIIFRA